MNWKNIFSLPKNKKSRKKLQDLLNRPESTIDASRVTGGLSSSTAQTDVGWIKNEVADGQKL
jgi:hypothetical protein